MKIRRMKRTTKQYITVAIICIIVIGGAAISTAIVLTNQIREEYRQLLNEARQEINRNQREAFIAAADISTGDIITKNLVERKIIYTSQPEEAQITEDDIGKLAMIHIPTGTQILKSMLAEHTVDSILREVEYDVIFIGSNIRNNDYADIRIMFPNGEDFIVLPKKMLKNISEDFTRCFLWLSEEEILRMSSAIVDAYLYNGTKIYTTKYIEPNIQDPSFVTYEPAISTLILIKDNPNIVETAATELCIQLRKAMENRLADSYDTKVEDIEWELYPNSTEKEDTLPEIFGPKNQGTYGEEARQKEDEMDYGP